jgi:uncharacterized membrane protein YphA (DoxX/SURF4 family)
MNSLPLGDVALVARVLVGVVLVVAGFAKVRAAKDFASATRQFRILPGPLVSPVSRVLPVVELGAGLGILSGAAPAFFGWLAVGLFLLFTLAIIVVLARGDLLRCSCFGALAGERLTWLSVARNVVLTSAAVAIAWSAPRSSSDVASIPVPAIDDLVPAVLTTVAVVFMYVASIRALGLEATPSDDDAQTSADQHGAVVHMEGILE